MRVAWTPGIQLLITRIDREGEKKERDLTREVERGEEKEGDGDPWSHGGTGLLTWPGQNSAK